MPEAAKRFAASGISSLSTILAKPSNGILEWMRLNKLNVHSIFLGNLFALDQSMLVLKSKDSYVWNQGHTLHGLVQANHIENLGLQEIEEPHPLKIERELRGWSQAKVAEVVGTNTRTVIRWEQGQSVPYPYYREHLCLLYGKNSRELGLLANDGEGDDVSEKEALEKLQDARRIIGIPLGEQ